MFERQFYRLDELSERWGVSVRALLHLGIQDRAQICANIYGMSRGQRRERLPADPDPDFPVPEPETEAEKQEAAEWDAAFDEWSKRTTREMPFGIYELTIDTIRVAEMPDGFPLVVGKALKFDGSAWWDVEFEPEVTIKLEHLCMLHEEVVRLDREIFQVGKAKNGASVSSKPTATADPTAARERSNLLTVIAALCDYSDISHQARGASMQIARLTEEFGASVSDDSVRRVLSQIRERAISLNGKPLATTERNTLLTIIAGLSGYSGIEWQAGGAWNQIAKLTEEIGAPVPADTVRQMLLRIPDALESRMK